MTPDTLATVMEATWPPARQWQAGPFLVRDGAGGGKRVSAASLTGPWEEADLATLERMSDPLVMLRETDTALDAALAARGWQIIDPVVAYAATVATLQADLPTLSAFPHWPPLHIARALWEEGGIGPARLSVMDRVTGPKTAIMARLGDRPAGVAFVALHGETAMLHALEVRPALRRQGVGETLMRAAANWAAAEGAAQLALVVTARNIAARALYTRIGMQAVGQYHYRMK
ncbi:MAG: GNAT family N-acetyltransferase [Rhodobacterales bacterium]|nr:MAG: GNAT family N-acetyltransferase [Rhodobacterales bacterium]